MPQSVRAVGDPEIGIIVVAAGRGERLGAQEPKAFVPLAERPLLSYCIRTITGLPYSGKLVIVAPASHLSQARRIVADTVTPMSTWHTELVSGGSERDESVRNGLTALPQSVHTVLVHDAARPLASAQLFTKIIDRVQSTGDAIIPALPVTDTIKRISPDGIVRETVDRSQLAAVQTPQGFPAQLLISAHHALSQASNPSALPTDDAEVVQRAGGTVRIETGEALAMKITTVSDLDFLTGKLRTQPDWFSDGNQTKSTGES